MSNWINSPIITTLAGAVIGAIASGSATYYFGLKRDKRLEKLNKKLKQNQKKDNINNCENCRNLELKNKIQKEKHQELIRELNKIGESNPKTNDLINKESLSKLAAIRDETAAEFEKLYGFAFSQFVRENFTKLLASSSNFKKLKEKGWDIRLDKEGLKKMVWELETFKNFRNYKQGS